MKLRTICLFLGTTLLAGCSEDDLTGTSLQELGTPAPSPILAIDKEPAGSHCDAGGTKITSGIDKNGNGKLESSEVAKTQYVCNGDDGDDGEDGKNGKNGKDGKDGKDGARGQQGKEGTPGLPGPKGDQGEPGEKGERGDDGVSVLLLVTPEGPGANCTYGGQRVDTGADADADGVLDQAEISDTSYVCNGASGGPSVAGFRLVSKITGPGGPIAEIVSPSPDGKTLAYTSSTAQTVGFADISDPAHPALLGTVNVKGTVTNESGEPTSVAFAPDGVHAVVVVKDSTDPVGRADAGALVVIDVPTRTIVGQVALGVGPDSIHLTPDGSLAVVAIEDEENPDGNNVAQARPGSVQLVQLNYVTPSSSVVTTIALTLPFGNAPTDPQPEYIDITKDGKTAVVTLQENNLIAVIDLATKSVTRYIDAGTSKHARADLSSDKLWDFSSPFEGQLQPDGVCLLPDQTHFITANEGDTPNGAFGGVHAGGRGFSVFDLSGARSYDSGDSAEFTALRSAAYPEARSGNRGIEAEGCAAGTFSGTPFAFVTGERDSALFVVDVANPAAPVIRQVLGAPMRPESAVAIESRGLVAVGGEGNGTGGGIWLYEAVSDEYDAGHGSHIYGPHSDGTPFGALSALAYEPSTGFLLGIPDNAYLGSRIWSFAVDHDSRRLTLVRELVLKDAGGEPLTGYDPEGLTLNPEGGYIVASEGVAGNGAAAACTGSKTSNRILFLDELGKLDPGYGDGGIVDLPCGTASNALDWSLIGSNGYEGVAVVDSTPGVAGGLKVYLAFQRPLTGQGSTTRIGEYDVDSGSWGFYFYVLDPDPGPPAGNTFLSELLYLGGDRFAVIERDQGWAGAATNKTIRTFSLASGVKNDITQPVQKTTAYDLLTDPFRMDQEKIEGLALGGGSLWVVNDNDGGQALEFFMRLDPSVLGAAAPPPAPPEVIPNVVLSEINSQGTDFVELHNLDATAADVTGWRLVDGGLGEFPLPITSIPAGGYVVFDALSFGLGSADSVTLYTSLGTQVDKYAWTAHVASVSRCGTTGLALWPTTGTGGSGAPSPGAANNCTGPTVTGQSTIVVNEVSSNAVPGAPNDFIELYNNGPTTVDISNWKLTDNDPTHVYVIPSTTTIAAGAALFFESGPSFTFGLGSADSAVLLTPYDQLANRYDWTAHVQTASRCPNGTGAFVNLTPATPGAANSCAP